MGNSGRLVNEVGDRIMNRKVITSLLIYFLAMGGCCLSLQASDSDVRAALALAVAQQAECSPVQPLRVEHSAPLQSEQSTSQPIYYQQPNYNPTVYYPPPIQRQMFYPGWNSYAPVYQPTRFAGFSGFSGFRGGFGIFRGGGGGACFGGG